MCVDVEGVIGGCVVDCMCVGGEVLLVVMGGLCVFAGVLL